VGALIVVGIFTLVVSYILIKVTQIFVPLRVDAETETNGLDLSAHGERAYDMNS
jgi:Amt family ammonium transporter